MYNKSYKTQESKAQHFQFPHMYIVYYAISHN